MGYGCCKSLNKEVESKKLNRSSSTNYYQSRRKAFLEKTLNSAAGTKNSAEKSFIEEKEKEFSFVPKPCKCPKGKCKDENWMTIPRPYFIGLNCSKIGSNIVASQRLSTCLIKHYSLIKQFKYKNIGMIVNLQREGEHPYCGPQKELEQSSGFSYLPEDFIIEDIECKNYGWRGINNSGSMEFILEIVKDMASILQNSKKKVLVHCHSGLNRTCLVIACYIIYECNNNKSVETIVSEIKKERPGSLTKPHYIHFLECFRKHINTIKVVFSPYKLSLKLFLKNQRSLLIKGEEEKYRNVPKLLSCAFDRIIELYSNNLIPINSIYSAFEKLQHWSNTQENLLRNLKAQINIGNYDFSNVSDIFVLVELTYDWLGQNIVHIINPNTVAKFDINLHNDIIRFIEGSSESLDKEKIIENIKSSFSGVEYETIICVSIFANKVLPTTLKNEAMIYENEESQNGYGIMLENIHLRLMGYSTEDLYYNKDLNVAEKIMNKVNLLGDIVSFFAIIIGLEYNGVTNISKIYNQNISNFLKWKKLSEIETNKKGNLIKESIVSGYNSPEAHSRSLSPNYKYTFADESNYKMSFLFEVYFDLKKELKGYKDNHSNKMVSPKTKQSNSNSVLNNKFTSKAKESNKIDYDKLYTWLVNKFIMFNQQLLSKRKSKLDIIEGLNQAHFLTPKSGNVDGNSLVSPSQSKSPILHKRVLSSELSLFHSKEEKNSVKVSKKNSLIAGSKSSAGHETKNKADLYKEKFKQDSGLYDNSLKEVATEEDNFEEDRFKQKMDKNLDILNHLSNFNLNETKANKESSILNDDRTPGGKLSNEMLNLNVIKYQKDKEPESTKKRKITDGSKVSDNNILSDLVEIQPRYKSKITIGNLISQDDSNSELSDMPMRKRFTRDVIVDPKFNKRISLINQDMIEKIRKSESPKKKLKDY